MKKNRDEKRQNLRDFDAKSKTRRSYHVARGKLTTINTPFAVHYEKIRIHLREMATNSAKLRSSARKGEHLRINQIQ